MAKVTIQSMAKELGLSRNTVSMALKGNPSVKKNTREMVLNYALKEGYFVKTPVFADIAPGTERERHIMILRKPDEAFYWDRVMNGITEEASRNNCQTHVAVVTDEEERAGTFPLGLNEKVDGVIFMKMMSPQYVKKIKEHGHLIFMMDDFCNYSKEPLGDVVRVEGKNAVKYLAEHLIGQGIQRIGFLNESSTVYETMHDRYMGYMEAIEHAGLHSELYTLMPSMESDHFYFDESFDEVVARYLENPKGLPEAVVCGNDVIAMKLTKAFRRRGIRVPEDVAVTGFDNDEEGKIDPFFSTVHADSKWLGRRLVQSFMHRLKYPDAPYEKVLIYGQPVVRLSSRKKVN